MKKYLLSIITFSIIATSVCQAQNPILWGMTTGSGANDFGILFNYNSITNTEAVLHNFNNNNDGFGTAGSLIQASNGLLYATTNQGGANGWGIIFSYNISTSSYNDIYNFDSINSSFNLIQANNGLLYSISGGGAYDSGAIFSYNISIGTYTDLYDFGKDADAAGPVSLIQANNGLLYGTTIEGGVNENGTIFSYDISKGQETVLYDFGNGTDGFFPQGGALIQASNGLLYGMTADGGANGFGMIFSYNISTGKETDIQDFSSSNLGDDNGSIIQARDTLIYGIRPRNGVNNKGIIFSYNIATEVYTDLHDFGAGTDGAYPQGALMQASNGLLYGTTAGGGADSSGTIFSYNISTGTETDIHDFNGTDGSDPFGSLIEVDTPTGVNQLSVNNNQLSIYPNPTSGQFTIKLDGNQNGYTIEIYNVVGEKVYQSVLNNSQNIINLYSQPDGMYFVYLK